MDGRKVGFPLSLLLALWKPFEWLFDAIGVVDSVEQAMDPNSLITRVLFWPYLGFVVSGLGLLGIFVLFWWVQQDRAFAGELSTDVKKAITDIRDKRIKNQNELNSLQREYGKWHGRMIDKTKPYHGRYPTEVDRIETEGGQSIVPVNDAITINSDHAFVRGLVDKRAERVRDLAKRLQESTMWRP
jgi:hypothetical protein